MGSTASCGTENVAISTPAKSKSPPVGTMRQSRGAPMESRSTSRVMALQRIGISCFCVRIRRPRVWSPCSCVSITAVRAAGSTPTAARRVVISRALSPASINRRTFPAVIRAQFPLLPLPRMVSWNMGCRG